jgi:hypothetical protein
MYVSEGYVSNNHVIGGDLKTKKGDKKYMNRKKTSLGLLFLIVALVVVPEALAYTKPTPTPTTANVTFVVTDNVTGKPVNGALVSLRGFRIEASIDSGEDSLPVLRIWTNNMGIAVFTKVPVGKYQYRVNKDDYLPAFGSIAVTGDIKVLVKLVPEEEITPTPTPTATPTPTPTATPTPTPTPVSYSATIQPIFNANCTAGCHSPGGQASFYSLTNWASTTASFVTPGNAAGSTLYMVVNSGSMPLGAPKLSAADILSIRNWINEGAPNN